MNVFYLDRDPARAAALHCASPRLDHLNKMLVEYAQLLSTAHRVLDGVPVPMRSRSGARLTRHAFADGREAVLYRDTHRNHPCAVWVRQRAAHYEWLYACFAALAARYRAERGREHAAFARLGEALRAPPAGIGGGAFEDPPQCINEERYPDCRQADAVLAYRAYYRLKLARAALPAGEFAA